MKVLLFFLALTLSDIAFSYPKTPDIKIAPGRLCHESDPDFTGYRYMQRVPTCRRNVSYKTKNKICLLYGVDDRRNYTVDHIIPLSLGGSNHESNLWCQHRDIFTGYLEYYYFRMLRDNRMRHVATVHSLLSWKYNPSGKDHVPDPPDGVYYPNGQ